MKTVKKKYRNLKKWAKCLFVSLLIINLLCVSTGIGALVVYADETDVSANTIEPEALTIFYDGYTGLKEYYYDVVRITCPGYTISANKDSGYEETYVYETIGSDASITLYFKSNDDPEAIESYTVKHLTVYRSPDITLKYNGGPEREWYNTDVEISADGFRVSDYANKGFGLQYPLMGTGTVTKDLYFKDIEKDMTINAGRPYTVMVKIDKVLPTGSLTAGKYSSGSFVTSDDAVLYTNKDIGVAFAGEDDSSGVDKIEYYICDSAYKSASDVEGGIADAKNTWKVYDGNGNPGLIKDKNNYAYAKIKDKAGNVTYIASGKMVYDTVIPKMDNIAVGVANTDNSKIVALSAKDDLSGVDHYLLQYRLKEDGKEYPDPTLEDMIANGIGIDVQEISNGMHVGSYKLPDIDATKTYIFYAIAIDKTGNVSELEKKEWDFKPKSESSIKDTTKLTPVPNGNADATNSNANPGGTPAAAAPAPSGSSSPAPSGSSSPAPSSTSNAGGSTKVSSVAPPGSTVPTAEESLGREIDRTPFISDATGNVKVGKSATGTWEKVCNEINSAPGGAVIEVEMSGMSTIPATAVESMNGKDLSVKFNLPQDVTWTIKGDAIDAKSFYDMDMSVRMGTGNIPEQVMDETAGSNPHVDFYVANKGEVGFDALLKVPTGKVNAGRTATIYCYDEKSKEMKIIDTVTIDADGFVEYDPSNGSDYMVVITEEPLLAAAPDTTVEDHAAREAVIEDKDFTIPGFLKLRGRAKIYLIFTIVISALLCVMILLLPGLQIPEENEEELPVNG